MEEEKTIRFVHGAWKGTLASRDTSEEMVANEAEARQKLAEHAAFYRSIGYSVWFATLFYPDGTETRLA